MKYKIKVKANKNTIAYHRIKEMILNNEIKCGDIISENSLAESLEMSRTPVREAVRTLCNEGFVNIHKGVGILVKNVTLKEVHDINAVRVVLEKYAIHNAVNDIQDYQLDDLIDRWRGLRESYNKGVKYIPQVLFDLDEETHELFINLSGNDLLKDLISTLQSKIHRYQKMFTAIANDDIHTINQHIGILQAIKERDADKACDLLERHIYSTLSRMFENNRGDVC